MIITEITGGKPGERIEIPSIEYPDEVFTYDNDPKVLAALKLATLINKCVDKFKAGEIINYLDLAQSLVENGVIVTPVKVGDTVYQADNAGDIYESQVTQVVYNTKGIAFDERAIGKTVFTSREAAKKALAERGGQ